MRHEVIGVDECKADPRIDGDTAHQRNLTLVTFAIIGFINQAYFLGNFPGEEQKDHRK